MALLNLLHYFSEPKPNKITVEFLIETNDDLLQQMVQILYPKENNVSN
jgi:hypothetical protein